MKRLVWARAARRDLFAIATYYGQFDPTLPMTLLARVYDAPLALLDFPEMGSPTRHPRVRKWRVRNTPFVLFYARASRGIEIRRVRHEREDWKIES